MRLKIKWRSVTTTFEKKNGAGKVTHRFKGKFDSKIRQAMHVNINTLRHYVPQSN